jgi:hypothetical protein
MRDGRIISDAPNKPRGLAGGGMHGVEAAQRQIRAAHTDATI